MIGVQERISKTTLQSTNLLTAWLSQLGFGKMLTAQVTYNVALHRTLKPDSLDSDSRSGFNVVSRELHTPRRLRTLHCWTGSHALSRSKNAAWIRIEAVWRVDSDPWSISDPDTRSCVESPMCLVCWKKWQTTPIPSVTYQKQRLLSDWIHENSLATVYIVKSMLITVGNTVAT